MFVIFRLWKAEVKYKASSVAKPRQLAIKYFVR